MSLDLETKVEQLRAQLAYTEKVRDAALHDVVYLRGQLDLLLSLASEEETTRSGAAGVTATERKANAEEKIRSVIEKSGAASNKKVQKTASPSRAGQATKPQ